MNTQIHRYGCHDRKPYVDSYRSTGGGPEHDIPTFGKRKCQFTRSELGQADPRCNDCGWKLGGLLDVLEKKA